MALYFVVHIYIYIPFVPRLMITSTYNPMTPDVRRRTIGSSISGCINSLVSDWANQFECSRIVQALLLDDAW